MMHGNTKLKPIILPYTLTVHTGTTQFFTQCVLVVTVKDRVANPYKRTGYVTAVPVPVPSSAQSH